MTPDDMVLTRTGLRWRGRRFPCVIGRGGIRADKAEGDGATPVGAHRIVGMLYRADRMARPAAWADPIGPRDLWCDAPKDAAYNHLVTAPFAHSHESLRRGDPLYDIVLITDWNWPVARPGRGSAIFLHRWRRAGFPTEGCIAFRPDHLRWISNRVAPGTRILVRS
ncbi:MAG: L,D-transpeptidase family protein [Pseudooceanicola sp.]